MSEDPDVIDVLLDRLIEKEIEIEQLKDKNEWLKMRAAYLEEEIRTRICADAH